MQQQDTRICKYCNKNGHVTKRCWQLKVDKCIKNDTYNPSYNPTKQPSKLFIPLKLKQKLDYMNKNRKIQYSKNTNAILANIEFTKLKM